MLAGVDRGTMRRSQLASIDVEAKQVRFSDGLQESYDMLMSTMPIDMLVRSLAHSPDNVSSAAEEFEHNGVFMVGIGYKTPLTDEKSWMYFPQDHVPFYRATNFAKYSPNKVPGSDTESYSSYMTEVSYSRYKPESTEGLAERVEESLRTSGWSPDVPRSRPCMWRTSDMRIPCPQLSVMRL
jgi:protoporphyrinogen oxidase